MLATKPTRYIPDGARAVTRAGIDAVVYLYEGRKPCAIGYTGKRSKPAFNYGFSDAAARDKHVADFLDGQKVWQNVKATNAAALIARREAGHGLTVGQVLYSSWGYEQTNVDFYEVVEVKPKSFKVVRVGNRMVDGGGSSMSANVMPTPKIEGAPVIACIWLGHGLKVKGRHVSVHDGKPKYSSWYG